MSPPVDLKLKNKADSRRYFLREYERAHRELLDAVLERAAEPGANIRALAREVGLAHGTIYNELGRRQDRADQLSSNGDVPAPAPHDDDPDAAHEPAVKLSGPQRAALLELARHDNDVRVRRHIRHERRRTVDALINRGLVYGDGGSGGLRLTRVGRELVERGGTS